MINSKDLEDNTPLHIAIMQGHKNCALFLLDNNADTNIQNKFQVFPLHQCVNSNQPGILEILIYHHSKPNINLKSHNGGTALHMCAFYDFHECARILLKKDVELMKQFCSNGFSPVHLAAQIGSNKVFELLMSEGSKLGYSRLEFLKVADGDNNRALHAAVQFGNLFCVKLCLAYGARIDEIKDTDGSTPVHLACVQGSFEIVKLMFEIQSELFSEVINFPDKMHMTPLHRAAMFNHVEIAGYLIEKGAHIDSLDNDMRSPLLLAASRCCGEMMCFLLNNGANIKLKNSMQRNILHLILTQGTYGKKQDEKEDKSQKLSVEQAFETITKNLLKVNFKLKIFFPTFMTF